MLALVEAVGVMIFEGLGQRVVDMLDACGGTNTVVQASWAETGASDTHPSHRVQAHMVPGIDLGQQLGSKVLGQWCELGVQDNVVQLFGQQFAVQVDVGAMPNVGDSNSCNSKCYISYTHRVETHILILTIKHFFHVSYLNFFFNCARFNI